MKFIESPNLVKLCRSGLKEGDEYITRDSFSGKYKKLLVVTMAYSIPVGLQCNTIAAAEKQN